MGANSKTNGGFPEILRAACAPGVFTARKPSRALREAEEYRKAAEAAGHQATLADVFHKMGIIEKWGTGLPRIFARCARAGVPEPRVVVGGSTVSIVFTRPGSATQETESTTQETVKTAQEIIASAQETTQETNFTTPETGASATQKVLDALGRNPTLTLAELAKELGMTRDGVKYHVNLLKKKVGLRHEGPTKKGRWVLSKDSENIT